MPYKLAPDTDALRAIISIRHLLLAAVLEPSWRLSKIRWFLVALLAFSHMVYAQFSDFAQRNKDYPFLLNACKTGESHLCASEDNVFVVSNWAQAFRIQCGARVRYIEHISLVRDKELLKLIADHKGYGSLMDAVADIKNKSMGRPIHIGISPAHLVWNQGIFQCPIAINKHCLIQAGQ